MISTVQFVYRSVRLVAAAFVITIVGLTTCLAQHGGDAANSSGTRLTPIVEQGNEQVGIGQPAQPRRIGLADLNDARILFGELEEQVRIAAAKLDGPTLDRKRTIGKLHSLITATESQITLLSAKIQRLEERQRQIKQDLTGLENGGGQASVSQSLRELLAQSERPLLAERERLQRLTGHRSRLQTELDNLRREHIQRLLEAAVTPDPQSGEPADLFEKFLMDELGGMGAN